MKKHYLLSLALMLIVLTACQLSGGMSTGGASAPPELQYIFSENSDPVGVTVTLDASHQAEALIPVEGGTLSLTSADGTIFNLDIPADALIVDTLIRMTSVSRVDGMPFGSEVYAVQFEPDGLQLYESAILTITPSQDIPVEEQIMFGYQGEGENLTLAVPVVSSSNIQILVSHFSGSGVTKGLLADLEPVRQRIGGDAEKRLQNATAERLQRERQRQLSGVESGELILDLESAFREYEELVLKPRIAAAGESCAAGRLAIQTLLGYERQRELLGISSDDDSNALSSLFDDGLMDTVTETCMKEEFELCRDDHIIHRILPAWLGLERQYALLGMTEDGGSTAALDKAREYASKCLTFELRFESQANVDSGYGGGYNSTVESKVKLKFNPITLEMKAQAPLVNTAFEFLEPDCNVTSNRGGGTFDVLSLAFTSDTRSPSDELGYVRDFTLIYFPGTTSESFTITCEDTPAFSSPPTPLWTGVFMVEHESEMGTTGGFVAVDWEVFGNEYFAKKEWIKGSNYGQSETEAGTFKLYHLPEGN